MTFTDDDLKRLKDALSGKDKGFHFLGTAKKEFIWGLEEIESLLARLEAAERICQQTEIYITDKVPKMYRMKELLEAWRKACDKGDAK